MEISMRIDIAHDILGLVDVQPTFMPGGELPVAGGDGIVPVVNRLLTTLPRAFATQDWHPADHVSFASQHRGRAPFEMIELSYGPQVLWPDHAIAGSGNAAIHRDIDQGPIEVIIRKGCDRELDSYSTFFENDRRTPTGLDGWLRQRGLSRLFLCGLATDFCVAWSAEDAVRLGYEVFLIEDACRGIGLPAAPGRTTMDDARQRLLGLGVTFINSDGIA
ncbi:bifunctional nicotinamidase/pyrazinamidase [Rhodopila sp.]|uniref:bifunctional nicotinamidase/pyrazinamidase n=1 Tax=Rhodopila sp. TaxID=2480087 RepID=UPI002BC206AA|nr:bifunctional nicotinamidase/pyrazinamidase [Rhodopila sp.]HVZ06454.1 bifunctional nicotinamidase/pyrazinamidase [Rhodopila sp.]